MIRHSRRRAADDFPLATIAVYGPDNTRATKLVVSILHHPEDRNPRVMRTWTTETGDVRTNEIIQADTAAFITTHQVKRTAASDRIIGCPHEEGVDYPIGRTCPSCPFWASIDRFTHEPIAQPVPSMSADDALRTLAEDPPHGVEGALASADAQREVFSERLLEALEHGIGNPQSASRQEASIFAYALYLRGGRTVPRATEDRPQRAVPVRQRQEI